LLDSVDWPNDWQFTKGLLDSQQFLNDEQHPAKRPVHHHRSHGNHHAKHVEKSSPLTDEPGEESNIESPPDAGNPSSSNGGVGGNGGATGSTFEGANSQSPVISTAESVGSTTQSSSTLPDDLSSLAKLFGDSSGNGLTNDNGNSSTSSSSSSSRTYHQ
jgi:hypothetical protein